MSTKKGKFEFITKHLDHTPNDLPSNKRLGAYIIDWALGGIFSGFPAVLMYGIVSGKSDMFSDLYVFEAMGESIWTGLFAGLCCLIFALFYYVYVPWKIYPGQTLGKRITGIKIETIDKRIPTLKVLLIRQVFAIFLIEGSVYIISTYIRQIVTLITRFYVDGVWQWIGAGITLLSVVLTIYTASHRALHDYIGKTRVVIAPKVEKKEEDEPSQPTVPNKPKELQQSKTKPVRDTKSTVNEKKRLPKKKK